LAISGFQFSIAGGFLQEFLIEKIPAAVRIIPMRKSGRLLIIGVLAVSILGFTQAQAAQLRKLFLFYSPACHRCAEVKARLMPYIEKKFKAEIAVDYRDISDLKNYKILISLQERYKAKDLKGAVPIFFFEGDFLGGDSRLEKTLPQLIERGLSRPAVKEILIPEVDLVAYFGTFSPLAVISAGLIDGINPCAFTVIVFFISFLALQGYRKRQLVIIGASFIFSVFLTYLLIGLGLFGFLYQLEAFWQVSKIINFGIGILSIILGLFCVYDLFKFKQTGQTEDLTLQLPQAVKNRIHAIIGLVYRKKNSRQDEDMRQASVLKLAASALATGFLVSILEAVCTGQVYLPTITFILKTSHLKIEAWGYLVLYNLMFILPLFIIFLFALEGVTSAEFSGFLRRHLALIKILMAVLFFSLGAFLLSFNTPMNTSVDQPRPARATAVFDKDNAWDFGQVRAGEVLKHSFVFKNDTRKVINIKEVRTSCGCAVSKVAKKRLGPRESTVVEVEFNTKGYSGAVQQYVYVQTDDPDKPITRFIIKAQLIK